MDEHPDNNIQSILVLDLVDVLIVRCFPMVSRDDGDVEKTEFVMERYQVYRKFYFVDNIFEQHLHFPILD
jgi:hypothetical protein